MRNLQIGTIGLFTASLLAASQAYANQVDVSFNYVELGNYNGAAATEAFGVFDVLIGPVDTIVGGSLTVTTGPDAGYYVSVPGTGSDGSFLFDNVYPPDSAAGPLWSATGTDAYPEMNMWSNGDGTYSLYGAPPNYTVESYGTLIIGNIIAVPDGGMTVALLGGTLVGLRVVRRKVVR